jgi:F-type H+-transporting ATPase subunit delta
LSGLPSRYATALFELADEAKALDATADDLRAIRAMLADSADLRRLLSNPLMGREDQTRAVGAVLEAAGSGDLVRRFAAVLAANRRLFALGPIADAFLAELARRRGEVTAEVTTAHALSEDQKAALLDRLRRMVGAKVQMEAAVDPALLGGMVVKVGSRMVDSSLRTKLGKLQHAMKGTL